MLHIKITGKMDTGWLELENSDFQWHSCGSHVCQTKSYHQTKLSSGIVPLPCLCEVDFEKRKGFSSTYVFLKYGENIDIQFLGVEITASFWRKPTENFFR